MEKREEDKKRISAMQRLARVLCSDLEERIKAKYGLKIVVSAGIGDFIVKEAADSLNIGFLSLSTIYGKEISAVFPAYAVAKLLENQ